MSRITGGYHIHFVPNGQLQQLGSIAINLFIASRHLIINISDQRYAHLCTLIPPQDVTDEVSINLHLHLERSLSIGIFHLILTVLTISNAPLRTPHSMLEYHNSFWARPSSGSSTKSPNGFSSNTRENCLLSLVQLVTVGVILRNILKPTYYRQ